MLGRKTKEQEEAAPVSSTRTNAVSGGTSVIAKEMRISGDCVVDGRIRIEGTVVGDVRAAGLELTRSGSVKGDLSAAGGGVSEPFVIAGRVDGRVHAPSVEVGPEGSIMGGVEADEAKVRGRVEGGIVARKRLILEETAVVEGDVRASTLALKEGGQVNGTIIMGDRAASTTGKERKAAPDPDSSADSTPVGARPSSKGPGKGDPVTGEGAAA